MSKCWNHLPQDRPTFAELFDELWELRNKGRIYVNIDGLVKQSIESEGMLNIFARLTLNKSVLIMRLVYCVKRLLCLI